MYFKVLSSKENIGYKKVNSGRFYNFSMNYLLTRFYIDYWSEVDLILLLDMSIKLHDGRVMIKDFLNMDFIYFILKL